MPFEVPDFAPAVERYREFLAADGVPTEILWVEREDVTSYKRQIWVRLPLPAENPARAEDRYIRGRSRGLGLRLETLCALDGVACCYVWAPRDRVEAEQAMSTALRFSVPRPVIHARPVRSRIAWAVLTLRNRRRSFSGLVDGVPTRDA
jgi:hypothetical protein